MANDSPIKASVQSVERAFQLLEIMASSARDYCVGEVGGSCRTAATNHPSSRPDAIDDGLREAAP